MFPFLPWPVRSLYLHLVLSYSRCVAHFYSLLISSTFCVLTVVSLLRPFSFCCVHIAVWPVALQETALPSQCFLVPSWHLLPCHRKRPGFLWNLSLLVRLLWTVHRNEDQDQAMSPEDQEAGDAVPVPEDQNSPILLPGVRSGFGAHHSVQGSSSIPAMSYPADPSLRQSRLRGLAFLRCHIWSVSL